MSRFRRVSRLAWLVFARRLGLVADALGGAVGGLSVRFGGDEFAGLEGTRDVEVVPDFVEGVGSAPNGDVSTVGL